MSARPGPEACTARLLSACSAGPRRRPGRGELTRLTAAHGGRASRRGLARGQAGQRRAAVAAVSVRDTRRVLPGAVPPAAASASGRRASGRRGLPAWGASGPRGRKDDGGVLVGAAVLAVLSVPTAVRAGAPLMLLRLALAVTVAAAAVSQLAAPASGLSLPWSLLWPKPWSGVMGRAIASRLGIRSAAGGAPPPPPPEPHWAQGSAPAAAEGKSPLLLGSAKAALLELLAEAAEEREREPPQTIPIEATLSAEQLIQHWGYPAEVHNIQSEDGYSLCLFRIPWSKESPPPERQGGDKGNASTASRPVVLFQHGLLQSADQWLLRGPGRDLAFMLSDLGYDVWLGNFRGNLYSRKHVHMSTDNDKFWDFSWHENGFYDLAAFIDYALAVSGQRSLSYIGHSMGTTALLVLLSTRPEYNRRVRVASLLAPVAYFGHLRGLLAMALPVCRNLERELRGVHMEVLPRGTVPLGLVGTLCRPGAPPYSVCLNSYMQAVGPDMKQLNATLLPTAMAHLFSGASLGQAVHYVQSYKTGQFRQFDHGVRWNTLRYGHPQPPLYNLSKVVAPIAFHYSTGDYLSHHRDVERLVNEVAGTAGVYRIPWKEFNHGDYMWATDTYDLLYKTVIKVFREHL